MKFNDEELSRILSAHANGEMSRGGSTQSSSGRYCFLEIATATVEGVVYPDEDSFPSEYKKIKKRFNCNELANWFDDNYNPGWPLGRFLRELEKQGLA